MRLVGRRGFTRSAIVGTAAVLAGCGGAQTRERDVEHEELHPGGGPCEEMEVENEDGTTSVQTVCPPYGAPPADTLR